MGYKGWRLGRGLNLKTAADAGPDDGLRVATGCSFDEVGSLTSARGRQKANGDAALGGSGSLLGGFDGLGGASLTTQKKFRFLKRGTAVYTNTTTTTALDDATNLTAAYATLCPTTPSSGVLAKYFVGSSTQPAWGAAGILSGFTYGGYAYLADGTATSRFKLTSGQPPTVAGETWGVDSPGFHYLTTAPVLATTATPTVQQVTVSGNHGLKDASTHASYPFDMNIEIVGVKSIGGIPDNEINCIHSGFTGGLGDISVATNGADNFADAAHPTFTITFQNGAGRFDWPSMRIVDPSPIGTTLLDQSLGSFTNVTVTGQVEPPVDCQQTVGPFIVTPTQGYFRFEVIDGLGGMEYTSNIPYNSTVAQMKAALESTSFFASGAAATTVCSVTAATTFTFTTPSSSSSNGLTGGGTIGFMRQGPTCTPSSGGALVGGTYYYAYAFYNGVAKSNFSAQIPITVTSNDKVVLTNVLIGPVGTTERHIYRTDVDGRQLYYIGKIEDNTTFTFTDTAKLAAGADPMAQPGDEVVDVESPANSTDALARKQRVARRGIIESQVVATASSEQQRQELSTNLGLLSDWTDHDPPPTDLKHVGLIGETAFGISGNTLRFSKAGEVEHWPLSNSVTPGRNLSETLLAWVAFDRDCILYTTNAIYRLSQVGLSFEDSRLEEIESPVGLAAEWGVTALDGQQGHVFLAKSGLYLFDGARVSEISYPIEPLFTDATHTYYIEPGTMSQAFMVTSRDRMMMAYRTGTGAGNNDTLLLVDFQDVSNPNFAVIPWGFTSMWREKSDNYVMAGDSSGYLYVLDQGYTDEGAAIAWSATSKEYRLNGQTMVALDELVLDADFAGATTTVTVTTRGRGSSKTATLSIATTGRQRIVRKLPVYMKGETAQIAVSSSYAGKRSLYEWGFTALAFEDEP